MGQTVYRPGMKRAWFNLSYDESNQSADIYLYDDIGFWGISANDFKEQLLALKTDSLNVYINSAGGEVDAGLAIYNMLKRHSAKVTVHIDGIAASIASVIAMAGDEVIMPETALMFLHKPWTIGAGNADDLQQTAEDLNKWETALTAAYTTKTGLDAATISAMLKDERLLSATEAIELGFADKLIETDEPAFAFRGAVTSRVLCHMAKKQTKGTKDMKTPEEIEAEKNEAVEAAVTKAKADAKEAHDAELTAKQTEIEGTVRAEVKAFIDQFGAERGAAYYAEGLSIADAQIKFIAALKAEKDDLQKKLDESGGAQAHRQKIDDNAGDGTVKTWADALAKHGNYAAARKAEPELYKDFMKQTNQEKK